MKKSAVHSLMNYTLQVPDLETARQFYDLVGVDVTRDGDHLVLRGTDGEVGGCVVEGSGRRVHHLTFGCHETDLAAIRAAGEKAGALVDAPAGFSADSLWLSDPDGMLVEVVVHDRMAPRDKRFPVITPVPAGTRAIAPRSEQKRSKPTRFSHMARFTKDMNATLAFYEGVLGLRVADRSGDIVVFMYSPHGSDHHILAFAGAQAPGLHHLTWEFATVDDIGKAATVMVTNGYTEHWGLGRHVIGSNFFHYFRDPWGSLIEFTCDMDFIPEGAAWEPIDYAAEDALYCWGPEPPETVLVNSET